MGPNTIIIPARLGARRLPNKPLLDLGGTPLVVRVAQRASRCSRLTDYPTLAEVRVIVATDSQEIAAVCAAHQVDSVLTADHHISGTDRVADALQRLGLADSPDAVVLNVQGDEPFIAPRDLARLLHLMHESAAEMATLAAPIAEYSTFADANVVKVVVAANGDALYFSRAPIPAPRDEPNTLPANALQHIGVYAYRCDTLLRLCGTPPTALEQTERLEQLRALHLGIRIQVLRSEHAPLGVDTPADLEQARIAVAHENAHPAGATGNEILRNLDHA